MWGGVVFQKLMSLCWCLQWNICVNSLDMPTLICILPSCHYSNISCAVANFSVYVLSQNILYEANSIMKLVFHSMIEGSLTEIHVCSPRSLWVGHVLVHRIQDLLLYLGNGVTVEHLDRDFWAVLIVRVHTAQRLGIQNGGGRERRGSKRKRQRERCCLLVKSFHYLLLTKLSWWRGSWPEM